MYILWFCLVFIYDTVDEIETGVLKCGRSCREFKISANRNVNFKFN